MQNSEHTPLTWQFLNDNGEEFSNNISLFDSFCHSHGSGGSVDYSNFSYPQNSCTKPPANWETNISTPGIVDCEDEDDILETVLQLESLCGREVSPSIVTHHEHMDNSNLSGSDNSSSSNSSKMSKAYDYKMASYDSRYHKKLSKQRNRKDSHNQVERNRRYFINDQLMELKTLLPKEGQQHFGKIGSVTSNKGNILKATVEYIKCLQKENSERQKSQMELKSINRQNLLQINEYEMKLVQHNIPPMGFKLTWRPFGKHDSLDAVIGSAK